MSTITIETTKEQDARIIAAFSAKLHTTAEEVVKDAKGAIVKAPDGKDLTKAVARDATTAEVRSLIERYIEVVVEEYEQVQAYSAAIRTMLPLALVKP